MGFGNAATGSYTLGFALLAAVAAASLAVLVRIHNGRPADRTGLPRTPTPA